jgi:hypothetical protein
VNAKAHLARGTIQKYEQLAREFKAHVKADAAPILMEDIANFVLLSWIVRWHPRRR